MLLEIWLNVPIPKLHRTVYSTRVSMGIHVASCCLRSSQPLHLDKGALPPLLPVHYDVNILLCTHRKLSINFVEPKRRPKILPQRVAHIGFGRSDKHTARGVLPALTQVATHRLAGDDLPIRIKSVCQIAMRPCGEDTRIGRGGENQFAAASPQRLPKPRPSEDRLSSLSFALTRRPAVHVRRNVDLRRRRAVVGAHDQRVYPVSASRIPLRLGGEDDNP